MAMRPGSFLASFTSRLTRKKILSSADLEESTLNRCLTTIDVVALGIGSTMGAGLYVVAGKVAHLDAGPAVTISFLVAAIASVFAGMCYAEFAARIPRAGSAYVYSYVTVGELMAFIIGWNLVLEYIIGTASVARVLSAYVDSIIDHKIANFFNSSMPMNITGLSPYPDFFAFGITLLLTVLLALGVKESTRFNNIFTCVNILVVLYVTTCGLFKLDFHNWNLSQDEVPKGAGSGGFMPFGMSKMLSGAATCFYAFVGFDCVATTGEETRNPQRAIPIGIVGSLLIIFLSYFSVSAVITLMCPYYLLSDDAALPQVFKYVGWDIARYIITVGAICGLSTSLLGAMFPLPRILYAMGGDGMIFRFMGKVSPRFQTPLVGTAISGVFAGIMAMMFDVNELVDMMSIGTLLAYTLVAVSVLILRYEADANLKGSMNITSKLDANTPDPSASAPPFRLRSLVMPGTSQPTIVTARLVKSAVALMCAMIAAMSGLLVYGFDYLDSKAWWAVILGVLMGAVILGCLIVLQFQPQSSVPLHFKVPCLPYLPAMSVFINVFLMFKLSSMTWLRFGVWMVIGFAIYFGYGIRYSLEEQRMKGQGLHEVTSVQGYDESEDRDGHENAQAPIFSTSITSISQRRPAVI